MKRIRLRQARLDDHAAIAQLAARYGLTARSSEVWSHLWTRNPAMQHVSGEWPIGWVLENDFGAVVGYVGNIPLIYYFGGKPRLAAALHSSVVDKAYRRISGSAHPKAILELLEPFYTQTGVALMMSSTASPPQEKNHATFGARRVPLEMYDTALFWIGSYRGFAAGVAAMKGVRAGRLLTVPIATALRAGDILLGKNRRRSGWETRVRRYSSFDRRFDALWDWLRVAYPDRLIRSRDAESLSWHFHFPLSSGKVRIIGIEQGRTLAAYAILLRSDVPRIGLTRMSLVDLQCRAEDPDIIADLISAAVDTCRAEGIHVLESIGFNPGKRAAMKKLRPHTRKLASFRFYYRASGPWAERLKEAEAWDPCTLDGDSTL